MRFHNPKSFNQKQLSNLLTQSNRRKVLMRHCLKSFRLMAWMKPLNSRFSSSLQMSKLVKRSQHKELCIDDKSDKLLLLHNTVHILINQNPNHNKQQNLHTKAQQQLTALTTSPMHQYRVSMTMQRDHGPNRCTCIWYNE